LVNDAADSVIARLLDNVDNDQHWVVLGELNGDSFIIISFGQEAFGNNCEDLKQKDIHPPELGRTSPVDLPCSNFVHFDHGICM